MKRGDGVNLRDGKWQYRFEGPKIDGKRKQIVKGGFNTREEAFAAKLKAMAEFEATGEVFKPSEISVSDFMDKWYNDECVNKKKKTTLNNYEKIIRLDIKPEIGKYKLRTISHSTLQKLIDKLASEGRSRNTISVISGVLTSSFNYAVEPLHYIQKNPMEHVKLPSKRAEGNIALNTKSRVYIDEKRMNEILARFPKGSSAYIPLLLGYRCGLRLCEAYALTWDDIDFENKTLSVNKQVQWQSNGNKSGYWYFSAPKYDSNRIIQIDDAFLKILKNEKETQERKAKAYLDTEYTFYYEEKGTRIISTNDKGKKINFVCKREDGTYIQPRTMQHTSSVIHNQLGFPEFDFHSLRHTHCTMLLDNGADPKYVQTRLGHKSVQITLDIYQHLTQKTKKTCDSILNNIYNSDNQNTVN